MSVIFDEYDISRWAYLYCKNINDDPEIRENITDSFYAFMYCKYINDDLDVRKYIIYSDDAYLYCKYVNDDLEVRKYITDQEWNDRYDKALYETNK